MPLALSTLTSLDKFNYASDDIIDGMQRHNCMVHKSIAIAVSHSLAMQLFLNLIKIQMLSDAHMQSLFGTKWKFVNKQIVYCSEKT